VNGFAVQLVPSTPDDAARYLLQRCTSVFRRVSAVLELDGFAKLAD
jgi:hypothetical protein